jgi:hypothetical protein
LSTFRRKRRSSIGCDGVDITSGRSHRKRDVK